MALLWSRRVCIRSIPGILTLAAGSLVGYLFWCAVTLPDISSLEDYAPFKASRLYSYDNHLLTEFYIERRNFIGREDIPEHVKNAFIAVEDKRFYRHCGIDGIRIGAALLKNIGALAFVEGASTITQQLAKMLFLTPDKTITRKIKEIILALQIEQMYEKDEILEFYLNHAYLGTRAYGIEAAARTYFGKTTGELTIAEAALLATLPKAPSKHSPFKSPEKAVKRRNRVLAKMLTIGFLNEQQFQQSAREVVPDKLYGRTYKAPFFVDYMRTELENRFGDRLYTSGLTIYSTLDYDLQRKAEEAVERGVDKLVKRGIFDAQIALVAVELQTGRVKAMVGGVDYHESQFNRAVQAKRQPGSAFKPIVYLAALQKGYQPNDFIDDKRVAEIQKEGIWVPQNYNGVYMGKVSLRHAFSKSLNAATVNLAKRVGIEHIIATAKKLGIASTIHPYYSSALGASEMTLLEMVCAYATLSHGYRVEAVPMDRIIDRQQMTLVEPGIHKKRIISKKVVRDVRSLLRSVVLQGTGKKARSLKRRAYGKTGTSNECADAWFIGFDENLITGVWVGRDDQQQIGKNETGARTALPIWLDFMKQAGESSGGVTTPVVVTQYIAE